MKAGILFALSVLSSTVLAHSGHGGDVGVQHDMEHSLWLLLGVATVVGVAIALKNRNWKIWK